MLPLGGGFSRGTDDCNVWSGDIPNWYRTLLPAKGTETSNRTDETEINSMLVAKNSQNLQQLAVEERDGELKSTGRVLSS